MKKGLNGLIALKKIGWEPLETFEIYQFLAVLWCSDLNGISLDKVIEALSRFDCIAQQANRMY